MLELQSASRNSNLQEAWLQRWNQRIEEAMLSLTEVQVAEGWDQLEVENLGLLPFGAEREKYLEALLLKGSLMRAQGQEQKSSGWLRRVLNKNSELQNPQSFRLLFEMGLDHWRREDLAKALDCFLLAERKARTLIEIVFTQSNILWCLESLDLERQSIEQKLQGSLSLCTETENKNIQHVREQWQAYLLRQGFYREMKLPLQEGTGQALYFQKWLHELPYTEQNSLLLKDMNSQYLWQASYRLRTLAGVWSPQDRNSIRIGDAIDRLYLWVWKWLAGQSTTKEKILWTLDSILQQLELNELSKENTLLLRNACSWLSLMDLSFKKKMPKLLNRLQATSSQNYPVLEVEFNLIQCLSRSDSKDLVGSLRQFPVFALIYQESQRQDLQTAFLPRLYDYLSAKYKQPHHKSEVLVNGETDEVSFMASNSKVKSPKMVLLLSLLKQKTSVDFAELEMSDPRAIYNLVARIRSKLSTQALELEGQEIRRGKAWPSLEILNQGDSLNEAHHSLTEFRPHKNQVVGSEAYLQAARALLPNAFTRQELEKCLKISKASACRMLEEWLTEKILEKTGNARSVQYHWRTK